MNSQKKLTSPIIYLTNVILFPGNKFPFVASKYEDKAALAHAAATNGRILFVTAVHEDENSKMPKRIIDVACVARIESMEPADDGNFDVTVMLECRAKIETMHTINGLQAATVSFPPTYEEQLSEEDVAEIRTGIITLAKANVEIFKSRFHEIPPETFDENIPLDESLDRISTYILISLESREASFTEFNVGERAVAVLNALSTEAEMLSVEKDVIDKVRDSIGSSQKTAFLREQLRVIKHELGEDEPDEIDELFDKIDESAFTDEIKDKLYKEVRRMSYFNPGSPDYALIKGYVETCLELPMKTGEHKRYNILNAKRILEEDHDGLTEIKERVIEFLSVANLKPDAPLQILCLVGPPGTGKTSVAKSIARAMGRKFVRVSLGGVRDESDIRGHRKTYVGAMPGRIINAFLQAKAANPVILLDEIDKMGMSHNGDPASALLEVLDMEQNHAFRDHYIEIPYDLSEALFITTANTLSTVPRPLLDRMEVIELHSYSLAEKYSIAKHHLIPKQLEKHGVKRSQVSFTEKAVYRIIEDYTKEAGVRNLEREIASVIRKCAVRIGEDAGCEKISIKVSNLEDFLGPKKILGKDCNLNPSVGVTNGLAFTELGGDMLKIEACILDGSGKLELTGSLGDVMKESARIAISAIRQRAESAGIDKEFHKTKDIHIHVPEGAVPKDGPSAGVTLFTTLYSALTGKPVRGDIAMTGEITLTGRVLPIGGLKEKSMAALSAGIKRVLIPKDNLPETEKFDESLKGSITYIPCTTVEEVIAEALV